MTDLNILPIQITVDEARDVIGCIRSAHAEYCISSDNCNCDQLEKIFADTLTANGFDPYDG